MKLSYIVLDSTTDQTKCWYRGFGGESFFPPHALTDRLWITTNSRIQRCTEQFSKDAVYLAVILYEEGDSTYLSDINIAIKHMSMVSGRTYEKIWLILIAPSASVRRNFWINEIQGINSSRLPWVFIFLKYIAYGFPLVGYLMRLIKRFVLWR